MRFLISLIILSASFYTAADTINHYINIYNNIPKMEMKADPQAQAWARSARNILSLTDESIVETILQGNELAKAQGKPLFCLPMGAHLTVPTVRDLILRTYNDLSSQKSDKDKMTVSQIAWLGVVKAYPCLNKSPLSVYNQNHPMQHADSGKISQN